MHHYRFARRVAAQTRTVVYKRKVDLIYVLQVGQSNNCPPINEMLDATGHFTCHKEKIVDNLVPRGLMDWRVTESDALTTDSTVNEAVNALDLRPLPSDRTDMEKASKLCRAFWW